MQEHATALAEAISAALPGWVERCVARRTDDPAAAADAVEAGRRAQAEVGAAVRDLLARDVDDQPSNPLALLRAAVRYPTEVLRRHGVAPVERDDFSRERFPDDVYDLTPANFADVDPSLHEPGITWGAAKAFTHMQRHRR